MAKRPVESAAEEPRQWEEYALSLEARLARCRGALTQIADPVWGDIYPAEVFAETKKIARAALAESDIPKETNG